MRLAAPAFLAVAVSLPAGAQVRPSPGDGNSHLQSIDYDPKEIFLLEVAPGYQLTLELSPDEQVQNVALGDGSAWKVSVNHQGDHLFIKASAPVATNMTVITSVRVYNFELFPLPSPMPDTPWHVRFRYPSQVDIVQSDEPQYVDVSPLRRALSRYRVSGDRILRPDSVTDDGQRTYISWSRAKPIPAVYAISVTGEEVLANGWMRDDVYVVDGVPGQLLFRIDARIARAVRLQPRKSRR